MLRFAVGVSVGVAAPTLPLWAQNSTPWLRRVGVLAPSARAKEEITLKPFFDEMRQLGWVEGRNIAYDRAYADDRHQELLQLAPELVTRKPELILCTAIGGGSGGKEGNAHDPDRVRVRQNLVDQFEALGGEVGFLSDPTEPLSPGDRTKLTRAAT